MRLDLKPLGAIAAPWRIPVCPKCHFVLYKDDIPFADVFRCTDIVLGDYYREHRERASYFLLGLLYEGLGKEPLDVAHAYLKASWQEEADSVNLRDDLQRSLREFDTYLEDQEKKEVPAGERDKGSYITALLLKGEILRRLGRFEEAKAYFQGLRSRNDFQGNFYGKITTYQITLCDQRDPMPHNLSEVERREPSKQSDSAGKNN